MLKLDTRNICDNFQFKNKFFCMSKISNNYIFFILLFFLSLSAIVVFSAYGEELKEIKSNTASLETDLHSTHIEQTIERLKQLQQTVLFELHPTFSEPPSFDFDNLLFKDDISTHPIVSQTSEPLLKEQLIASKGVNMTPKFEEIFLLLSDEMRLKACKKLYANDSQSFTQKIIHYLGKGTPEQALIINQILPYLKEELEENLIASLQENPQDLVEKRTIIYALGRIKSEKSVPILWNEIQATQSEEIQYTCVQSLANMPHCLSLEQWVQLLQYNSVSVSLTAAYAILEYGGSSAEEYIRRILLGEISVSQRVLEYISDRICNYPLEIIVPFSIEVMSRNPGLAQKFSSILRQRTGADLGPNPQLWADWWKEYLNKTSTLKNPENTPTPQNDNSNQPDIKVHAPRIRKR